MRFVSGRSRLPANPADISQRFQIMKVDRVSYVVINMSLQMIVEINENLIYTFNLRKRCDYQYGDYDKLSSVNYMYEHKIDVLSW